MMELLAPPELVPVARAVLLDGFGSPAPHVGSRFRENQHGTVRISDLGGSVRDVVVSEQDLLVECYGRDEDHAHRLAATAVALLRAASGTVRDGIPLRYVTTNLPVDLPDPDRPTLIRRQFIATVHSRMQPLPAPGA